MAQSGCGIALRVLYGMLRAGVHGDHFTILGYEEDLDWLRRMISEEDEVKFRGRIGPSSRR